MSAPNPRAYTTPPSATHALTPTRLLLTPYQDQPTVRSAELCSRQPEKRCSAANDRPNRRWELAAGDGHAALGAWRRRVTMSPRGGAECGVRSNSAPAVRVLRPCWVLPCAVLPCCGGGGGWPWLWCGGGAVAPARSEAKAASSRPRPDAYQGSREQGARRGLSSVFLLA